MRPTRVEKEKLIKIYGSERCYVVTHDRASHIPNLFTEVDEDFSFEYYDQNGQYILRSDAERNMAFQQLIPYAVIKRKDKEEYFLAKRTAGDDRLISSLSIGFGGHIDPTDGHLDVIHRGLERELKEELELSGREELSLVGLVRDLNSPTADHVGFVFLIEVLDASVKETDKMSGEWMSLDEIVDKHFEKLESWSKYIVDYLYHDKPKSRK